MSQSKYRQGKYIDPKGVERWFKDGMLHREDGPAVIDSGDEYWYKDGKLHREDGPAVIHKDGTKFWYKNGVRHREDGPAVIYSEGSRYWYLRNHYLNGKEIKEEDYLKALNCPIDELPLYINTDCAPLVRRRLNHDTNNRR